MMFSNPRKEILLKFVRYTRKRIAVAVSGGIDSSVSALILKNQGFDCVGVFMKNWDSNDEIGIEDCPIDQDRRDAQEVCKKLKIPFVDTGFVKEYWNQVFQPFLEAYQSGIYTPNPDVACNRFIKFEAFRNFVRKKLGIEYFATGHYCRIMHFSDGSNPILIRGIDPSKDQSYFLSMTSGENLQNVCFPVGEYKKSEIKEIARRNFEGLRILSKPESMGICFIGKRPLSSFLSSYFTPTPGNFVDLESGVVLGRHEGREFWTLGQNARIPGQPCRYYVAQKSPHHPDIFVVRSLTHPIFSIKTLQIPMDSVSWVAGHPPASLLASPSPNSNPNPNPFPSTSYFSPLNQNLESTRSACPLSLGESHRLIILNSLASRSTTIPSSSSSSSSTTTTTPSSSSPALRCFFKVRYSQTLLPGSLSIDPHRNNIYRIMFDFPSPTVLAPGQILVIYTAPSSLGLSLLSLPSPYISSSLSSPLSSRLEGGGGGGGGGIPSNYFSFQCPSVSQHQQSPLPLSLPLNSRFEDAEGGVEGAVCLGGAVLGDIYQDS